MKLIVALEQRFQQAPNSAVFTVGPLNYEFWQYYLEVFDSVLLLARVSQGSSVSKIASRADGAGVSVFPLKDYHGPADFLRHSVTLRRQVQEAVRDADAYMLNIPGLIPAVAASEIRKLGRVYAVSVVGNPWEALSPSVSSNPLWFIYRRILTRNARRLCRSAVAVRYVSRRVLPDAYPAASGAFTTVFSDVELKGAFATEAELLKRRERIRELGTTKEPRPIRLGFVGSFARMYKGPDLLLKAVAQLRVEGFPVEAHFAGDGTYRKPMEELAQRLGIAGHVQFAGMLPHGKSIFDFLDSLDLFVMPSRTEGLPRAMIEAMARGCPCIGSSIGGIPELLAEEDQFSPEDVRALLNKIKEVLHQAGRLDEMSKRYFTRAADYGPEKIQMLRHEFYSAVRARSLDNIRRANT